MEVKLSEISRRLIFRYYPVWFLCSVIFCFILKSLKWAPHIGFFDHFIAGQISCILIFSFVISSLYIFKPSRLSTQLIIMIISALSAIEIMYIVSGIHHNFGPIPFRGPLFSSQIFHLSINNAFFVIWFFFIGKRSCISEKMLVEEESKRLSNEKKVVENRLKLLQAQIEPQFLFNTLTSIVTLRDIDLEKAKSMQMHFIQYLRATLVKTRVSTTTVGQEMELIQAYLDIFKVSTGGRLGYQIQIDNDARELPLPSMLIQPLVENALSNGPEADSQGGKISIFVEKRGAVAHIEITDTWQRLSEASTSGESLLNVKERIDSLFDKKGQLFFESNKPTGLTAIIEVPHV